MSWTRRINMLFLALIVLVLVHIGTRVCRPGHLSRSSAFEEQFAAVPLHTNGMSGILITDRIKNQPLWGKWNMRDGNSVSFFLDGRNVMNCINAQSGRT